MTKVVLAVLLIVLASMVGGTAYLHYPWRESNGNGDDQIQVGGIQPDRIVCTGIVDASTGRVDVCAQIAGVIEEIRVTDGQIVGRGDVVAVMDRRRQHAAVAIAESQLELARARLAQVKAGAGDEEIQAAYFEAEAVNALLEHEHLKLDRRKTLVKANAASRDEMESIEQRVNQLTQQLASLQQEHAALKRGPLAEEIATAEAEVRVADAKRKATQIEREYCQVRAPTNGAITEIYRHAGDAVSLLESCPIFAMVDTSMLRLRLEIDEADIRYVTVGTEGTFRTRADSRERYFRITTLLPAFSPKRLFSADTTERLDTRTIHALAEVIEPSNDLFHGQRITAVIPVVESTAD